MIIQGFVVPVDTPLQPEPRVRIEVTVAADPFRQPPAQACRLFLRLVSKSFRSPGDTRSWIANPGHRTNPPRPAGDHDVRDVMYVIAPNTPRARIVPRWHAGVIRTNGTVRS